MITTLINTRDEEVHIERAVRSALALGPVFVVDSGSEDGTVAIARAAGAEVVEHEWSGYAAQKNWARENLPLTTDWVLHLDADEFLTPISRAEIERVVRTDDRSGYYLPRQNIFLGRMLKHAWWYPDYQLRLFRRDRGRYEDRSVHEHVILNGEVGFLRHPLMHENLKGIDAFVVRHARYAGLEAKEAESAGEGRTVRAGSLLGAWPDRRRALKRLVWSRVPSRAAARFLWMFLLRRGYRDGPEGRVYSELIAGYEGMIDAKALEATTAALPPAGAAAGLGEARKLLACPACREDLAWEPDAASCTGCGKSFPIVEGVCVLLPSGTDAGSTGSSQKLGQASFFDEGEGGAEFEITRPHGAPQLHRWLLEAKMRRGTDELEAVLAGGTAVSVCGGSGMDAEHLARAGASVICADISLGAALRARERAKRYGLPITPVVADAEALPLRSESVDLAYVHDGLHHLERPEAGLAEMARVARRAVSVTEPAQAAITRFAVKLGLALEREEAGNRVARIAPRDFARELERRGFGSLKAERYAMFYRHVPGPAIRVLSLWPLAPLARFAYRIANLVVGRFGNKLVVRAQRTAPGPGGDPR
jgi:SAM-dependent methyltransferase/glycosyltransferase involved in cell wall biosynthesis/uncharacterized protein YbaR (Trm112 family)